MPIEQLLALYGYGDRGGGGGENGEAAGAVPETRLPDDELEEEMEEDDDEEEEDDDEEDGDDESMESESSSSEKKIPITEDTTLHPSEETALPGKPNSEIKARSDLHLLYTNEEGSVPETRLLRSSGVPAASDDEADEEDDVDYAPGEDEWRKVTI